MFLSDILNRVQVVQVLGEAEKKEIKGISNNSREIGQGYLFVAVKGYKTDGHKFIEEAISNGASAIVIEDEKLFPNEIFKHSEVVKILVGDSRKALAELSNSFYGDPSHNISLIGITGTKGKTTTSFYIKHLLESSGHKVGLIGTIANYIGNEKIETKHTTPEAHNICRLLSEMIKAGCTYCVMEVSSHSLSLSRVYGLDFNFAVFTNITSDHFDFHQDFGSYLKAKKILFDILPAKSYAVMNIDDQNWSSLLKDSKAHAYLYGKNPSAAYLLKDISYDLEGTRFTIRFNDEEYSMSTKLIGEFNAYNAAAAISIGGLINTDWGIITKSIETMPHVPGRFEVIESGDKKVIIDYSHTTDSLRQALLAVNNLNSDNRKVYTVFGCGGDRDKTKRPEMGSVADELSDEIIITSDNPRTEDPLAIIEDIKTGVKRENAVVLPDRDEAIKHAICESESDAVILIAGKGHETYQEINGIRNHFSDKEKAEEYLNVCQN